MLNSETIHDEIDYKVFRLYTVVQYWILVDCRIVTSQTIQPHVRFTLIE